MSVRGSLGRVAAVAALAAGVCLGGFAAPARATTVTTTIHVPAMILTNICNNYEPVNVSGDFTITESSFRNASGGVTVTSLTDGRHLQGRGLVTGFAYEASDVETSRTFTASAPFPKTIYDKHWTKLVPQGPAPSMYLVLVLKEVVSANGTVVPTLNRTWLQCTQPCPVKTGGAAARTPASASSAARRTPV